MNQNKETYRASLSFEENAVRLQPLSNAFDTSSSTGRFARIKDVLKVYGCVPDPNDPEGANENGDQFLSGKQAINWKLEDRSRGACCDGSKPQIVCVIGDDGIETCWAECPDPENLELKVKFGPGSKGIEG